MGGFQVKEIPRGEVAKLIRGDIDRDSGVIGIADEMLAEVEASEEQRDEKVADALPAIKVIALIVAIISELVSSYFTFAWYRASQPVIIAIVLAAVLGVCEALLPELSIFFFRKRRVSYALGGIVIAALAAMATLFSMGATIGGLYDSRSKVLATATEVSKARSRAMETSRRDSILTESKLRIQKSYDQYAKDEALYAAKALELSAAGQDARAYEAKRDKARASMSKAESELQRISKDLMANAGDEGFGGEAHVRTDFYSFLAERVHLSPDGVEFLMISFPAVFNEVVAPAMLTIVLFL